MANRITDITFRNKFREQMNFPNTPSLEKFKSFFVDILNKYEEFVIGLLWSLTYDPDGQDVPKTYWLIYVVLLKFSIRQRQTICSELRYQYKKIHPDFLNVNVEGNVAQSYTKLLNVAGEVAAYQVFQKCLQYRRYSADVIAYCYCLLSKHYLNGICELGFNKKSADYLNPFITEITQLFKDITAENNTQEDGSVSDLPFVFGVKDTSVQNGCKVQNVQDDARIQIPQEADKNQLSADFAWQHKTELANFFKALEDVEAIGLTAELILSKRTEIAQLLDVSKLF